jgi:Cft2 family RNA processing exonuclease
MKIREIIREDTSAEDQLGGGIDAPLAANLLPVLMFLKKRSEDKGLSPKLLTSSLIQLVQNAGDTTFSYEDLVAAHEGNESVKNLIKDFNKDQLVLKSADDDAADIKADDEANSQPDPEQVVGSMAKKATDNRM